MVVTEALDGVLAEVAHFICVLLVVVYTVLWCFVLCFGKFCVCCYYRYY